MPSLNEYDHRTLVPEVFLEIFLRERVSEPRSGERLILSFAKKNFKINLWDKLQGKIRRELTKFQGLVHTFRFNFLFEKGDLFSGLAYHPHLSGKKGHDHRKREWRFFKTRDSRLNVDGQKTEVFEYDDVMRHHLRTSSMTNAP